MILVNTIFQKLSKNTWIKAVHKHDLDNWYFSSCNRRKKIYDLDSIHS